MLTRPLGASLKCTSWHQLGTLLSYMPVECTLAGLLIPMQSMDQQWSVACVVALLGAGCAWLPWQLPRSGLCST